MDPTSAQTIQTATASDPPKTNVAGIKRWTLMLAFLLAGIFFIVRGLSVDSSTNVESQLLAMTASLRQGLYFTGALMCLLLLVKKFRSSASRN
jgi:hypothetical protein